MNAFYFSVHKVILDDTRVHFHVAHGRPVLAGKHAYRGRLNEFGLDLSRVDGQPGADLRFKIAE